MPTGPGRDSCSPFLKVATIAAVQLSGKSIPCETALNEKAFENTGIPKRVQICGLRVCAEMQWNAVSPSIVVVGDMQRLMKVSNEVNDVAQSSCAIYWATIFENAQLIFDRAEYTASSGAVLQGAHGFAERAEVAVGEAARNVDIVPRSSPLHLFHVVRPGCGTDERVGRFVLTIPGSLGSIGWASRSAPVASRALALRCCLAINATMWCPAQPQARTGPIETTTVISVSTKLRNQYMGNYLASTGAGICSFGKRGTIASRLATCHTAEATTTAASFTSSGIIRS